MMKSFMWVLRSSFDELDTRQLGFVLTPCGSFTYNNTQSYIDDEGFEASPTPGARDADNAADGESGACDLYEELLFKTL